MKKEVWYSICSAHREYKEDCLACNTGCWHNVWLTKIELIVYWISPRFWRWYVTGNMKRDTNVIKKRKKLWDIMGWGYRSPNELHKKGSLNCGCGMCKARTFIKKKERRDNRHKNKINLKFEE